MSSRTEPGEPQVTHLTPEETSKRLRRPLQTLANWRVQGKGPRFLKCGRSVLYPVHEVEAFERANTVKSTAEYPSSEK